MKYDALVPLATVLFFALLAFAPQIFRVVLKPVSSLLGFGASRSELQSALALREETIKDLREKGRRVTADRDRWEAEANRLQAEIAGLKTAATAADQSTQADIAELQAEIAGLKNAATAAGRMPDKDANKFRELKVALVKMLHPDALGSASAFERRAREDLFKEINAEIDRIDGKRRDA